MFGQLRQDRFAGWPQRNDDFAAGALASDQSLPRQPIDQLDRRVMTELEPLRKVPDRRAPPVLQSLHLEQQEILLRCDARVPRRDLANMQKLADVVTQLRQRPIVNALSGGRGAFGPRLIRVNSPRHSISLRHRNGGVTVNPRAKGAPIPSKSLSRHPFSAGIGSGADRQYGGYPEGSRGHPQPSG
jgi:hypothetical protein